MNELSSNSLTITLIQTLILTVTVILIVNILLTNNFLTKEIFNFLYCIPQDVKIDVCAILNDTTGTLMSCAWKNKNCRIGLILGKEIIFHFKIFYVEIHTDR